MPRPRDSILDVSAIYLFGRIVDDLTIRPPISNDPGRPPRRGDNNFLARQLNITDGIEIHLARIYLFSFEGGLFDLSRPAIYLVHGTGMDIEEIPDVPGLDLISRSPASPSTTGIGSQSGSFARSLKVWAYDKSDFTIRIDATTGTFEQTLLGPETGFDPRGFGTGSGRSSGGRSSGGRSSGSFGRSSGAAGGRNWDTD
ncbi:hypothetical protein ABMA59_22775 [Mesorhizobium sp. CN2-181]